MWSNWRIWFTWVFAILFGVLSTAGEGLHLLPGQGHGHGACCHDACCHDRDDGCKDDCRSDACCNDDGCDDDACVGDSADHSPAAGDQAIALVARLSAGVEVHGLPSVASRSTFCLCDDNCAICKFFGQAVWHTPAPTILDWQFLLQFHRTTKKVVVVCRWDHLPFLSRAPPATEAC